MRELLKGHPASFYDAMGMTKENFRQLLFELGAHCRLRDSRYISAVEKLGMFMYAAVNGATYRQTKQRFQRSSSTVSRYVYSLPCHDGSAAYDILMVTSDHFTKF